MCKGGPMRLSADILTETLQAERKELAQNIQSDEKPKPTRSL